MGSYNKQKDENEIKKTKSPKKQEKTQNTPSKSIVLPIISDNEGRNLIQEFRINLIHKKVQQQKLANLASKYDEKDAITMFEFTRILQRKPFEFTRKDSAVKIIRYLTESRSKPDISYSDFTEIAAIKAINHFIESIGEYTLPSQEILNKDISNAESVFLVIFNNNRNYVKTQKD